MMTNLSITKNSSVSEIDTFLRNIFQIDLDGFELFSIRLVKIYNHLNKWKLEEPLEFKQFDNLSFEIKINPYSEHGVYICFERILMVFYRQDSKNTLLIRIGNSNRYKLTICDDGEIKDILTLTNLQKPLNFLTKSHLVNKKGYINESIWL